MPLTIKKILENDIKPTKSEYNDLKDLDSRMHALKFSNDIASSPEWDSTLKMYYVGTQHTIIITAHTL